MKIYHYLAASAALLFAACSEPLEETFQEIEVETDTSIAPTKQQTILGKAIENPYSLNYMRQALAEYQKTSPSKAALNYEIEANFLHVRFLPANADEFNQLLADTTIELFDHPMLCEIEQEGEAYHDPTLPEDAITWQYTTVPIDYKFPNIEYEIIDSCFVPEDEPETLKKSRRGFNPEDLTAIAFRLAGQEYEETNSLDKKRCRPSGQFRVQNTAFAADSEHNYSWTGIIGIKVRVYNGIRWDHTHTDVNGNYKMSKRYATRLHYHIKFRTSDDIIINNLMIDLDAADMGLGWHPKNGYSKDFYTSSKVWMWATVNNAIYIFRKQLCPQFNIPTPNMKLHVFASQKDKEKWAGSAPLCRHVNIRLADWQLFFTQVYGLALQSTFDILGPDVIIYHNGDTKHIYSTVFHEMSHVCHFTKAGKDYWKQYVKFVIGHFGYGKKGQDNADYVGLGEMWGNYFGNYVCCNYYFGKPYNWDPWENWYHPGILRDLYSNTTLTYRQIYNCLTPDITTYELFKQKLIKDYGQKEIIKQCFKTYGF